MIDGGHVPEQVVDLGADRLVLHGTGRGLQRGADLAQLRREHAGGRPPCGIGLERPRDDVAQLARRCRDELGEQRRGLEASREPDAGIVVERPLACEQLEQHEPRGVDVVRRPCRLALHLLGRRVVERADEAARLRDPALRDTPVAVEDVDDAEVEHLRHRSVRLLGEEDVLGLDVAVNHPSGVHVRERLEHVGDDLDRSHAPHAVPLHRLAEVDALELLHDEVAHPVRGRPDVVDLDDVRMADRSEHLGLALHPLGCAFVVADLLVNDLRDVPLLQANVLDLVDDAHAARADLAYDLITRPLEQLARA